MDGTSFWLWDELVNLVVEHAQAIHDNNLNTDFVLDKHSLGGDVHINGSTLNVKDDKFQTLLVALYARLYKACKEGNKSRASANLMLCLEKLRGAALLAGVGTCSKITQLYDTTTGFGTGVVADPLTFIPDKNIMDSRHWEPFGSAPDKDRVIVTAPSWAYLVRRSCEDKNIPPKIKKTTHYVLGHLINDNLNGSGGDSYNLTPLWEVANKLMSSEIEEVAKEAVSNGFTVTFIIKPGGKKGDRKAVLEKVLDAHEVTDFDHLPDDGKIQYEIVKAERDLLMYLIIVLIAKDEDGNTANKIVKIENYIPDTVPVLT